MSSIMSECEIRNAKMTCERLQREAKKNISKEYFRGMKDAYAKVLREC